MQLICVLLMLLVELVVGESDIGALLELKKGIQTSRILDSWDSKSLASSDVCPVNWYGISCTNGHITSITLNNLALVGEFSFLSISKLQMLRNLSISNNHFNGTITEHIGLLKSLQSLDLSGNLFTGSIPSQLSSLRNLVLLNISSNTLCGEIPSGFGNLKLLKILDFHSNGFVGDVMTILTQFGSVVYVDLSCNGFTGFLDVGIVNTDFISSVSYLNISHNNLTGELFPHDGMPYFDNLEVFDASDNRIVGKIPSFSFVVSLRIIKLRNNRLSGSLPAGLLQESSMVLSEMDLSHNQLEGPVESITCLNLRSLNLSSNRLSGSLPARIGHCAIIDLSNNMFSGNLTTTQSWGNYIEVIELSSNELTGTFSNQTSQFLRLTSLKISNNSLQGILPPLLGLYPELQVVDFSHNKLTGSLHPTLLNSTKLVNINLSWNNFSGAIPSDANGNGSYSLLSLDLSHNLLEGGIPDDLPETMLVFNVSYNNLSGVVPQSLQRFPASSFHPGNSLLVVPNEANSPKGDGNLSLRSHGYRLKSATRAELIAGLISAVLLIAILSLVIYCRICNRKSTSSETGGKKALSSFGMESSAPKDVDDQESTRKVESPPSKKIQHQPENSSSVCFSPEKLAGDLHLYDSSLKLSAEELSSAPAEAVGTSCHGTLYKAVLSSGQVLAVKLLKEGIAKGRKEFAREAKKLGHIRHPNLVSLQGFYWGPKEHEKLLISNYIQAPSLALYLHGTNVQPLSIDERLKIALDVACCLTYLHTEMAIPHGNLKSTNILIEIKNVVLTDYSLHRLLTSSGTAEQVLNAGALGYLPPEFTSTTKPCPSMKSDVYAFGVILMELLTGRSSADIIPDLSEWVRLMAAQNRRVECYDTRILDEAIRKSLDDMLTIALKCVLPAAERPDMNMVFQDLSLLSV